MGYNIIHIISTGLNCLTLSYYHLYIINYCTTKNKYNKLRVQENRIMKTL